MTRFCSVNQLGWKPTAAGKCSSWSPSDVTVVDSVARSSLNLCMVSTSDVSDDSNSLSVDCSLSVVSRTSDICLATRSLTTLSTCPSLAMLCPSWMKSACICRLLDNSSCSNCINRLAYLNFLHFVKQGYFSTVTLRPSQVFLWNAGVC